MNAFTSVKPKSEARPSSVKLKKGQVLSMSGQPIKMNYSGVKVLTPAAPRHRTLEELIEASLVNSTRTAKIRKHFPRYEL